MALTIISACYIRHLFSLLIKLISVFVSDNVNEMHVRTNILINAIRMFVRVRYNKAVENVMQYIDADEIFNTNLQYW